jgi:hypothetical protein
MVRSMVYVFHPQLMMFGLAVEQNTSLPHIAKHFSTDDLKMDFYGEKRDGMKPEKAC